ncbi:hypothetical protein imdm_1952 [gamma proteobacterium IMCC2047]|nr:hypothetical protein imdm_1952 [gamma proteobacterium IMCC2047]
MLNRRKQYFQGVEKQVRAFLGKARFDYFALSFLRAGAAGLTLIISVVGQVYSTTFFTARHFLL